MKLIIASLLSFALLFTLTACGQAKQENMEKNDAGELQNMQTMDVDKTLILYFSYSGNTEKVAKQIADYTGADIIRLEPVDPYPEDYDACVARAEAEHPANARPELKTELNNLSDYDTIILGWPCWNYSCPMLILTMLEQYDFSDKTILPFTTHGGSGFAQSIKEMKVSSPDTTYLDGLAIYEKNVDTSEKEITEWLANYGYAKNEQ